jgi:hypothetical protein
MGNWNGLTYNVGLSRNDNIDWLEINKLNLGDPEILEVNDGETAAPTKSFIQLERGTVPNISQCHTIATSGTTTGIILILKGLSAEIITMLDSVGNLELDPGAFGLTSYSTMVLVRSGGWHEIARSDNN